MRANRPGMALCFFRIATLTVRAQTIEVTPAHVPIDEAATVRVNGCQPGARISISAELRDGDDGRWRSQSDFRADAQGTVDTSRDAPVAGSRLVDEAREFERGPLRSAARFWRSED